MLSTRWVTDYDSARHLHDAVVMYIKRLERISGKRLPK
jgi:hypothetical protein